MYTNSSSPRAQGSAAPADPSLRTVGLIAGGAPELARGAPPPLRPRGRTGVRAPGSFAEPLTFSLASATLQHLASVTVQLTRRSQDP